MVERQGGSSASRIPIFGPAALTFSAHGDQLAFIAADRATEVGNGIEIGYSIPKEGALLSFDMLAIPADAPNPENARAFRKVIMSPETTVACATTA